MKALFKVQRVGKAARPILKYVLTLKSSQKVSKMDKGARVGDVLVSDDMKHLQAGLKAADRVAITAAAKQIESHTRIWTCDKHRHRDHFTISAPAGMSHKLFRKLAIKAIPELAIALKLMSYVAVIHKDCKHPHLHIIADAYAPSIGKGVRRHITKDRLNKLISMEWTKHFKAPTPSINTNRSERGKEILKESFKNTNKAKVDLAASVYKALDGKIYNVDVMVKKLKRAKLDGVTDFFDKKGKCKPSASVTGNDGTKLRLSHMVKNADLYKETQQFIDVDSTLTKPKKTKNTKKVSYKFTTPVALTHLFKSGRLAVKTLTKMLTSSNSNEDLSPPLSSQEEEKPKPMSDAERRYYTQQAKDYENEERIHREAHKHALKERARRQKEREKNSLITKGEKTASADKQ